MTAEKVPTGEDPSKEPDSYVEAMKTDVPPFHPDAGGEGVHISKKGDGTVPPYDESKVIDRDSDPEKAPDPEDSDPDEVDTNPDPDAQPADPTPDPAPDPDPDPAPDPAMSTITRTQPLGAAPPPGSPQPGNSNPNPPNPNPNPPTSSVQDPLYHDIYSRIQASVAKQKADPNFDQQMLYREAAKIVDKTTDDAGLLGGVKNNLIRGTRIKRLMRELESGSQKITISGQEYTFAEAKQHGLLPRPSANRIAHLYAKAQMGSQTSGGQFIGQIKQNYQLEQIADKILRGDTKISIAGRDFTLQEAIDLGLFTPRTFGERLGFNLDTAKATTLYNAFSQAFSSNLYQNQHQPADFKAKAYQRALDTFLPNHMPKTTPDGYEEFAVKFLKKQLPGYSGPADDLNTALQSTEYQNLANPAIWRDQNHPESIHFADPAHREHFSQNPATGSFFLCPAPQHVTSILEAFTSACEASHLPYQYSLNTLPDHNDKITIQTNAPLNSPYVAILTQIRDDHPDWFAGSGANPLWGQIDGLSDVYYGATPKDPNATYTSKRADLIQAAATSWLDTLETTGAITHSDAEALLKHQKSPTPPQIDLFTQILTQTCASQKVDSTNFALFR